MMMMMMIDDDQMMANISGRPNADHAGCITVICQIMTKLFVRLNFSELYNSYLPDYDKIKGANTKQRLQTRHGWMTPPSVVEGLSVPWILLLVGSDGSAVISEEVVSVQGSSLGSHPDSS